MNNKDLGASASRPGSHPTGHAASGVDGAPRVDPSRDCTGHVASPSDAKVCGRCGIHIDELRPEEEAL